MDVEAGAHNVAGLVMPKTSARPKSAAPDGAGALALELGPGIAAHSAPDSSSPSQHC